MKKNITLILSGVIIAALFVLLQLVFIVRQGEIFVLMNNGAPAESTKVNDVPVGASVTLQDGDRVQLGNVLLRFQMREARNRVKKARMGLQT